MKYHDIPYLLNHPNQIKPPVLFENTIFWLVLLFVLLFVVDELVLLFGNKEQEAKSKDNMKEQHYNNNIKIETKNKPSKNSFNEVNKIKNSTNSDNNSSYNNQNYYKSIGNVNGIEIKINKKKKRIKK